MTAFLSLRKERSLDSEDDKTSSEVKRGRSIMDRVLNKKLEKQYLPTITS